MNKFPKRSLDRREYNAGARFPLQTKTAGGFVQAAGCRCPHSPYRRSTIVSSSAFVTPSAL